MIQLEQEVLDSGAELLKYYDTRNSHPYTELDVSEDATGKPTNVQVTLDQTVINAGGSIGQIFGSAIGRAIAGNNQFAQIAAGTVGGFIGQRLAAELAESLQTNVSNFDFADAFANFNVGISGAAAGSVASFLTAELGTALGLSGYGAQLFNAAVGGYAGSVLNQAIANSFNGVTASINWTSAFSNAATSIGSTLGSMLANQIVHAENIGGAIGGQLAGAVGGIIGAVTAGLDIVLDVVLPGIGAFLGTLLGTLIGNAIGGGDKYPTSFNYVTPGTTLYVTAFHHSQDGGDSSVPAAMGNAALGMVNAYLSAVNGVGIDHGVTELIGYQLVSNQAGVSYLTYTDSAGYAGFYTAEDAVRSVATNLLQQTEAIGGNLLLKRAHHNGNAAEMLTLAGDLQVAQDYERYLDNREVINALMAANPNSAFTAGWAATFARVQDLGLSHYGPTDFYGGLAMGYLDSVRKAGLNFDPANLSVKHGSDGSVTVEIHVAANVDIPGVLSVFANHTNVIEDAGGKTLQLVFTDGLAAGNYHGPASASLVSGVWQVTASAGNNIWFGRDDVSNQYTDTQASSQDVLVGGAQNDVIRGGNGADFIDGGAGNDQIYGGLGNDILHGGKGADVVYGGQGNDVYTFNRGDGVDTVLDDYTYTTFVPPPAGSIGGGPGYYQTVHANGGSDTLAFGTGIKPSDVMLQVSGNDLIVGVRDLANPTQTFAQLTDKITLQNWDDALDRIETFVFADGTTIDLSAGISTIEASGSTTLVQIGNNYYFYRAGIGPELKYNGAAVVVGQIPGWSPIGAEQMSNGGYQIVWKNGSADQYTIWTTDNNGAFVSYLSAMPGKSSVVQAEESVFHQDLNGDGAIHVQTATDFNDDGASDLLFLNNTSSGVAVWELNGAAAVPGPQVGTMASGYHFAAKGDFNGDGRTDLLMLNDSTHDLSLWLMSGTQVTSVTSIGTVNAAGGWHFADIGDFNGDGKNDLFFLNDTTHGAAVWQMNGSQITASAQIGTIAAGWHVAGLGDFNADGKTDLFFVNDATNGTAIWLMNGTQITANLPIATMSSGWHYANMGDFNGDGKTDLLFLNDSTHGVAVWLMDGTQITANPQIGVINAANGWRFVDVGDFNGDGKSDLFFLNDTTHGVAVWQMNGTQVTASPQVGIEASGDSYVGLKDVNGDHKSDILFQNGTTHVLTAWQMDGVQITANQQIAPVDVISGWHLVT